MTYPAITTRQLPTIGDTRGVIEVCDGNGTRGPIHYQITEDDLRLGLLDMHRNAVRFFLGDLARYVYEYIPGYWLAPTGAMNTFFWVLPRAE